MFGGVAVTDNDTPLIAAYLDLVPVEHAHEAARRFSHDLAVRIASPGDPRHALRIQPVLRKQFGGRIGAESGQCFVLRVGGQEFRFGHPQRRTEALRQPAGVAEMIGMKMRHQYAHQSRTTNELGENPFPVRARVVQTDAAVHRGPSFSIAQQPEIDVVQCKRQRHAQPVQPRRNLADAAGHGRFRERVAHRIGNGRDNGSLHEQIPVEEEAAL